MEKLKVFQTYYKEEQYKEYNMSALPSFVECVNTNTASYPHSELNPFWSEFMFMKYVYEHLDDYDCQYIGFDQYKRHFNYSAVEKELNGDDAIFVNKVENVNLYNHYCLSHNKVDIDNLIQILVANGDQYDIVSTWKKGVMPVIWGSCFIMLKETFREFGAFLFKILESLDKAYNLNYNESEYINRFTNDFKTAKYSSVMASEFRTYEYQRRAFGYLAERLLLTWIVNRTKAKINNSTLKISPLITHNQLVASSRGKNVLLFCHEMSLTGAPRALLNLGIALKEQGYSLIVISPFHGKLESEFQENGIRVAIDLNFETRLRTNDKHADIIMRWADTIILNTIISSRFLPFMEKYKAKKILWVHEGTDAYKSFGRNWKNLFTYPDAVYTVGEYSNQITKSITGRECGVLNYFIDDDYKLETEPQKINDDKIRLSVIGNITSRKGHHLLPRAISLLPEEIKNRIELHIIGKCSSKAVLSIIQKAKLPQIKVVGEMSHANCLKYLQLTDGILTPSLDDPMPICNTEALMFHKPIITSTKTGTASYIKDGENGFIVEPTAESIADGIKRFVESYDKLEEIGDNGRLIFEAYFAKDVFLGQLKKIF